MKTIIKPPTIQIDTREQRPWTFAQAYREGKIAGTYLFGLNTGDYALKDYPDLVVIERKKSVGELYGNFIPNDKRERFYREMTRLNDFKYKYIIVEQTWDALYNPVNFKFAKQNMSFAGNIVLGNLLKIMSDFNVHVIFAGDNAEHTAITILLRHYHEIVGK